VLEHLERSTAAGVGVFSVDIRDHDGKVKGILDDVTAQVTTQGPELSYPDLGGATLPPADGGAPDGYGGVESYFFTKAYATGEGLADSAKDAQALIESLQSGAGGTVSEVSDASSFLVPGQAPENFVQDLRWSAGALLGSIDWVAEKVIGFSILQRCVYGPLAGDWQGIYRCSEAWAHCGDAANAIGHNHAGLVATTPATWKGDTGNAFRALMTSMTAATVGLSAAYAAAGGYVKTISTVCKLACTGIGSALNWIANKLMELAAKASNPAGWVVGAFTAYGDINGLVKKVRLINTIIETVATAIQDFAEAKTGILDKLTLLEGIAQGVEGSAAA
jgi:uncharacterized protein YukE